MQLGECVDFLRPFIWNHVSGLMQFWGGSDSECAYNFVQISKKVQRWPWQWLDKHLGKETWAVHGKSKLIETEKFETGEQEKSRACSSFSLTSRGLITKGDFWPKTTWQSSPNHPTFFVSPVEDKTERPLFWHNWGDWGSIAGSAEQPQDIFKKLQKCWERCILIDGTTSRVMMASRPKVSFWTDGSISPGNYRWPFVYHITSAQVSPSCTYPHSVLFTVWWFKVFCYSVFIFNNLKPISEC
jgi:hypothetical protein